MASFRPQLGGGQMADKLLVGDAQAALRLMEIVFRGEGKDINAFDFADRATILKTYKECWLATLGKEPDSLPVRIYRGRGGNALPTLVPDLPVVTSPFKGKAEGRKRPRRPR
jgi:hypothetical protein